MRKQTQRATTTDREDLIDKAVELVEELGVRIYARRHQISLPVARACVEAIKFGETKQDETAFAAILEIGERQLSVELGMLPAALDQWLDGGYDERDTYPRLVHLERIDQALNATAA
jgi:hypothetical protein